MANSSEALHQVSLGMVHSFQIMLGKTCLHPAVSLFYHLIIHRQETLFLFPPHSFLMMHIPHSVKKMINFTFPADIQTDIYFMGSFQIGTEVLGKPWSIYFQELWK